MSLSIWVGSKIFGFCDSAQCRPLFTAAKTIQELKEVQKKSTALIDSLKKEEKLTKPLKLEISAIDNLEDLNETIKIYKTKKSSALQKSIENGAETALEQGF